MNKKCHTIGKGVRESCMTVNKSDVLDYPNFTCNSDNLARKLIAVTSF